MVTLENNYNLRKDLLDIINTVIAKNDGVCVDRNVRYYKDKTIHTGIGWCVKYERLDNERLLHICDSIITTDKKLSDKSKNKLFKKLNDIMEKMEIYNKLFIVPLSCN